VVVVVLDLQVRKAIEDERTSTTTMTITGRRELPGFLLVLVVVVVVVVSEKEEKEAENRER
jgi:hypothetical protein